MCDQCLETLNLIAAAMLSGANPKFLGDAQEKVQRGIHVHEPSLASPHMIATMRALIGVKEER